MSARRFVCLTNIPTPYRLFLFRRMHEVLRDRGWEFEVWFMASAELDRDWRSEDSDFRFPCRFLGGRSFGIGSSSLYWNTEITQVLRKTRPDILLVAGAWVHPTVLQASLSSIPVRKIFWSESHFGSIRRTSFAVNSARRWMFSRFSEFAVPGELATNYVMQLSPAARIHDLPNIVDPAVFHDEVVMHRRAGGLISVQSQNRRVLLIVARLSEEKGLLPFLEATEGLNLEDRHRLTVLIAGSGPLRKVLGAGNYVKSTMLPSIRNVPGTDFVAVCTASGASAVHVANKYGFGFATTDASEIIHHSEINTVVIATRHHLHAAQVVAALDAGKHVFCEKPLCLNESELQEVIDAYRRATEKSQPILMVGFNRRFAPLATKLKDLFSPIQEPLIMNYRVNAEAVADSHWIHDPAQGGGRIIGELCHFVDLMTFLCGSEPDQVVAMPTPKIGKQPLENTCLQITFRNGSVGAITYTSRGDRAFSKERLEVFAGGKVAVLNDFRSLELFSNGRRYKERSLLRSDKGHRSAWQAMVRAVLAGEHSPVALHEIVSTSKATFRMVDSVRSGRVETVESAEIL